MGTLHQYQTLLDCKYYVSVTKILIIIFVLAIADFIAAPPSEPTNLTAIDVGADNVTLNLTNPSFTGMPPFLFLKVEFALTGNSLIVFTQNVTVSNSDPLSTNTFTVDGLQPNTSYSVRVRAVSIHPAVEDILGTWSSAVTFITILGGN